METVILLLVFFLVSSLSWMGYRSWTRQSRELNPRLQGKGDAEEPSQRGLLLGSLTPALAEQIPLGDEQRGTIQKELHAAGIYRASALMEYNALRSTLVILPLIAAGVISLVMSDESRVLLVWGGAVVVSMLGFSMPRLFIHYKGQARGVAIERGLPTAIEMLTLCLSAGQNVLNSLERVARELARAFPDLSFELQIVHRQSELRSLESALANFANRVGIPHLRNLAVILTQSENLGTDAVSVLREYADHMRFNQRQRAQELANRAPFKLLFPAYIMGIGAAILIVSPPVLEMGAMRRSNFLTNNRDLLPNQTTTPPDVTQATPTPAPPPAVPNAIQ